MKKIIDSDTVDEIRREGTLKHNYKTHEGAFVEVFIYNGKKFVIETKEVETK